MRLRNPRLPYYRIRNIDEDGLRFDLWLFWPVDRKDPKGIPYECFDSILVKWTLSYDCDADDEGRPIDCSGLSCKFDGDCSEVRKFYDSPLRDLNLNSIPVCCGWSLGDAMTYVKEIIDAKIKTTRPMPMLRQTPILTCSDNFNHYWNPNYRKLVTIAGFKLIHYKDGKLHSSERTCYELTVKKKLTQKQITALQKAGVKNGGVFEEFPPRITETEKGFHYTWSYGHSTE